jgi:hypothetical protein
MLQRWTLTDVENIPNNAWRWTRGGIESAPSTVPSIAHVDSVEDVAGINGTIAELIVSCLLKLPFKSVGLKNSWVRWMCQTEAQRIELRPTVGHAPRICVLQRRFRWYASRNSYACCLGTSTSRMVSRRFYHRFARTFAEWNFVKCPESICTMLERICGYVILNNMVYWDPVETRIYVIIRGKVDFMGPGFLLETKYVWTWHSVQLVSVCLVASACFDSAWGHTVQFRTVGLHGSMFTFLWTESQPFLLRRNSISFFL